VETAVIRSKPILGETDLVSSTYASCCESDHRLMISYSSEGLNQRLGRRGGMC